MYSSQPELNDNWTKVSYKRGRPTHDETEREAKHAIEIGWLSQTSTSSHYTAPLEEESEDKQQKAGPEETPKPPLICITGIKIISLIQLLGRTAREQYEIKDLTDNQVKVQPKKSESYRTIIKAFAEKLSEFHTYKLKRKVKKICTAPSSLKKSRLKLKT
jgi:hypothetical protein